MSVSGSESLPPPCSVWIVFWHDERRGDRNVGAHGVFANETMAREEADRMNRLSGCVYTAVNYVVTPNKGVTGAGGVP